METNEQIGRLETAACLLDAARGTINLMERVRALTPEQRQEEAEHAFTELVDEQIKHALNQIKAVHEDLEDTTTGQVDAIFLLPAILGGFTAFTTTLMSSLVFNQPPDAAASLGFSSGLFVLVSALIVLVSFEWMREE